MSTAAQIAANTANAQSSTGPRSNAGKAASSKNGITLGLFTTGDFVRPAEQTLYAELTADLLSELAPLGLLERNLVEEIRRAMWRLRRCGEVESHLAIGLDDGSSYIFDPMETTNIDAEKVQRSVDRARAQAHRLLHKCTAELLKLQTNRQRAKELAVAERAADNANPIRRKITTNVTDEIGVVAINRDPETSPTGKNGPAATSPGLFS